MQFALRCFFVTAVKFVRIDPRAECIGFSDVRMNKWPLFSTVELFSSALAL